MNATDAIGKPRRGARSLWRNEMITKNFNEDILRDLLMNDSTDEALELMLDQHQFDGQFTETRQAIFRHMGQDYGVFYGVYYRRHLNGREPIFQRTMTGDVACFQVKRVRKYKVEYVYK